MRLLGVALPHSDLATVHQFPSIGNTKTGASAASHMDELGEEETYTTRKSAVSLLVSQCPAFLNELGDEQERNVALSHATAQRRVQQAVSGNWGYSVAWGLGGIL